MNNDGLMDTYVQILIIKSLTNCESDASAVFRDPFGQMDGAIHRNVKSLTFPPPVMLFVVVLMFTNCYMFIAEWAFGIGI
jgi:hypothetical protein